MAASLSRAILQATGLLATTINNILQDPLTTGSLLWILTRGPDHIRERLLQPLRNTLLAKNAAERKGAIVGVLTLLTVLGTIKRINQALDKIALNDWQLRRRGAKWEFGPAKKELVVITGGSSGFGYEMVKGFSDKARVVVLDINELPGELAALPDVDFFKCDLSDLNGIVSCVSAIKNKHGNATVLVNNAGIANVATRDLLETRVESLERIFKINLLSHFILVRELLPGMIEARKGHVVTIASAASFLGRGGLVDYCATKAGAMAFHEGLREELLNKFRGDHRIRTTSVHPSWHATGIIKPIENAIKAAGIKVDPASNVSDAVIKQVINDKGGKLIIPTSVERVKRLRTDPVWLTDVLSGTFSITPKTWRF